MAGGRGSHHDDVPGRNCRPDLLASAIGRYGAMSRTPMLWVYTRKDCFFPPSNTEELHAAFAASGGQASFIQPGSYGDDGHHLFFGHSGSVIWGPLVQHYLDERRIGPH